MATETFVGTTLSSFISILNHTRMKSKFFFVLCSSFQARLITHHFTVALAAGMTLPRMSRRSSILTRKTLDFVQFGACVLFFFSRGEEQSSCQVSRRKDWSHPLSLKPLTEPKINEWMKLNLVQLLLFISPVS